MEPDEVPTSSELYEWVRKTFGNGAAPLPELAVRTPGHFDSLLLCNGPGAEPGVFSAEHFSWSRWQVDKDGKREKKIAGWLE